MKKFFKYLDEIYVCLGFPAIMFVSGLNVSEKIKNILIHLWPILLILALCCTIVAIPVELVRCIMNRNNN